MTIGSRGCAVLVVVALCVGCGGGAVGVTAAAGETVHAAPVVRAPSAAPAVMPAKIELRSVDRIREGGAFTLSIVNVGGEAFRFQHPGASNGCGAFHWDVSAVNDKGYHFVDGSHHPGQMCTMAIVPPRLVVIAPGETVDLYIDTESGLFPSGIGTEWGPVKLEPGAYTFFVNGAGLALSAPVTISEG